MWRKEGATSLPCGRKSDGNATYIWRKTIIHHGVGCRIFTFLVLASFIMPLLAEAALPFTVKPGHPRVYVDQARVDEIRAASQATIPLNGLAFPQSSGTFQFDILPSPKTDVGQGDYQQIFDGWNSTRNHLFVRHSDGKNPNTGMTYCNTDPSDNQTLCMQLALQSSIFSSYVASRSFALAAGQWHTIKIAWNSVSHVATLQIDADQVITLAWAKDANNVPVEWRPDGQIFTFAGRDMLDNIRVYSSDNPSAENLLVDYPMSDASGFIVSDVSENNTPARISPTVTWDYRSQGDSVLKMNGGLLRIATNSVLTESWLDFYSKASSDAATLNSGGSPVNVATAGPGSIIYVARNLGLSYLVTKNDLTKSEQFRTAALKYADRLIDEPVCPAPVTSSCEFTEAGRIEAMGTIYDWLFEVVSTATRPDGQLYRDVLALAIKNAAKNLEVMVCGSSKKITADWNCSVLPADPNAIGGHSHQDNTEITAALLAIIDEHPELEGLLDVEYQNFVNGYNPARAWISVDGGHHMGWDYGATYTFLDSIQLWNNATTNVSMLEDWQGKLIDRYIYALRGDTTSFPASGDAFVGAGLSPSSEMITAFALWGSKYYGNLHGQRFYSRWILPAKSGSRFNELVYWQPNLPESPLEELPYSRMFRNAGQVVMRDTWDYANATLLEFKSTSFWSEAHHHLDQNAFTVFYKAPLLVDSGYYDSYGTSHWYNYFTRTVAHNTLTIWDPAESFIRRGVTYGNL